MKMVCKICGTDATRSMIGCSKDCYYLHIKYVNTYWGENID
jgi:hypothetical protein